MLLAPDETLGWRQLPISTRAQVIPGLMIYRFMHNLYYANCHVLSEEIMSLAGHASPPLSWICIDATAVNDVDFTAAETLRTLHGNLNARGIRLVLCGVVDAVRQECDRSRLTDLFGRDAFFPIPAAVVTAFRERNPGPGSTSTKGNMATPATNLGHNQGES
jgi:MFS superfamily sulfate permease-like transporter